MDVDDDHGQQLAPSDEEQLIPPKSPLLQRMTTTADIHEQPRARTSSQRNKFDRILTTPRPSRERSRARDSPSSSRRSSRSRRDGASSRREPCQRSHRHSERHTRTRTRSRSGLRNDRLREELELERQRLRVLEGQLKRERERQEDRERARYREMELYIQRPSSTKEDEEIRRSSGHHSRKRSPGWDKETGRSRYDSTSNLFVELLKVMNKQTSERDSFPVLNNVLPEFDPLCKEQPISTWLSKVDECAEIYGWNNRQTIHYALPKLSGHAKLWYQGLPSIKRDWPEWKALLMDSFPATENYAELLTEMLNKRARFGEPLELYYFSKINLLNRCKIFGKEAVDCILHGVDDRGVRLGAQAANFEKPEQILQFFKTLKVQTRDTEVRKDKRAPMTNVNNPKTHKMRDSTTLSRPRQYPDSVICFNCREKGHPCSKCPKPIVTCSYCHLIGHLISDCPKKNSKVEVSTDKSVLRILLNDNSDESEPIHDTGNKILCDLLVDNPGNKYKIGIKINNKPIFCQVDLGSEATLIRKTDAENLDLHWVAVDGPLLRGLGNIPYVPLGKVQVQIDVQGVNEKGVDVFVVSDRLINTPVLLGHTFTERPNVRIIKTETELRFEKVDQCNDTKITLKTENLVTIGEREMKAIRVNSFEKLSGNVYIGGSVRGCEGSEYFLLPGEYEIHSGTCLLLVQNLGTKPITFQKGSLIARALYLDAIKHVQNLNITTDQGTEIENSTIQCGDDLSSDEKQRLNKLLDNYSTCFSTGLHDLGYTTEAEMVIRLKDSEPVVYRPYRMSYSERQLVQVMIDDMLKFGIVRESKSPYASPIVLVHKKTGDKRLCVDYRALNHKTKRDHYPLPRIEDLLDRLSGQSMFTTLDLASGYHQIPIAEESIEKTAFVTPDGQYEYTRMPFGLANAPAVFQRVMHKVLAKVKYVIIYMDDILIPSASFDEGLARLEEVLNVLQQSGLTLKKQKCNFFQKSIEFLGFEISKEGIKPGLQKVQAVSRFSTPTNPHDVRRFLGLSSFFRRFVKGFALIARPLTSLLKKDTPWRWTSEEDEAFETLKSHLIKRPVLALYDHAAETQLHTDASKVGLAGILLQRSSSSEPWRPVAYYSRQTTIDEQKLHSFELETLAVVSSLAKFRVYLLGIKFTIVTDCNALRSTFTKRDLVPRISRWWIQFLEFDCEIEYRAGEKMAHVDALSRNPIDEKEVETHTLDILAVNIEDWVTTVQSSDAEIKIIKEILQDPSTAKVASIHKEYKLKNGRVFRIINENTIRWVVPRGVRWQLLKANHDDVGHFGFEKTLERLRSYYWFPKMRRFTKKYVAACLECAHHKIPSGAKEGELHPIPKIDVPFHTIHADHLGPFVRSKHKNSYLLVIVDSFTKYVNLTPVRSTKSKESIKVFKNYFSYFGTPTRLITDRGTSFTSKKFKSFVSKLGIKHILNSVATPRANGQVERYNRTILSSLSTMSHGKGPEKWDDYVQDVQVGINSTVHEVTKKSPTELLFGRKVNNPSQGVLSDVIDDVGGGSIDQSLHEVREQAKSMIDRNQEQNKERFDRRRKRVTKYKEGDLVRVIRAITGGTGQSKKLEPKCQGPYRIKKILPHDRFVIEDTPLTKKGRRYENTVSIDKIFPWLSFDNDPTSNTSSDNSSVEE
ncbi:uncharacterized protein LOC114356506 [Ostrinia furnacalis]|uniref:uncharacterized protein LOC114356506 n=1 Tax=Ostrinia furnacalis TaxID=93504 RepID=UPI00103FC171|nr:uncharacterized protein LOC114356506 [Ostrinia furnacalis]